MKNLKILILIPILLVSLFSLSGCGYTDMQKYRQEITEKSLRYINEKYAEDPSFKKYERKDIVSKSSFCADMISVCVTEAWYGRDYYKTENSNIGIVEFKDGNKVYNCTGDTRQSNQIRKDFEKYFYNEIINAEYTNEEITAFSEYNNTGYSNQEFFDKYYDGNIKDYITGESINFRGNITIIIDKNELDDYYEKLMARIKNINMNLSINYKILFVDKEYRNQIVKMDSSDIEYCSFKDEAILAMTWIQGGTKSNNIEARKYVTCGSGYGMRLHNENININLDDITITKSDITREEMLKKSTDADIENDINKNRVKIKINDNSYIVCYDSVYEVKMSQRMRNLIQQSGNEYILVDVWVGRKDSSFNMGYVLLDN